MTVLATITYAVGYSLSWPFPVLCGETGSVSQVRATGELQAVLTGGCGPALRGAISPPHPIKAGVVFVSFDSSFSLHRPLNQFPGTKGPHVGTRLFRWKSGLTREPVHSGLFPWRAWHAPWRGFQKPLCSSSSSIFLAQSCPLLIFLVRTHQKS